jgi:hypothetical protein
MAGLDEAVGSVHNSDLNLHVTQGLQVVLMPMNQTTWYLGSSMRSPLQRGQRPGLVKRFRLSNTYPHTRQLEGITTRRRLCGTTERAMWER